MDRHNLRNLSSGTAERSSGNAAEGEHIFATRCSSCHRIKGRGGSLGPDLSRIAANQSNEVLTRAIREASRSFTQGFEPVTLVSRDGQTIRGTRKGEDAFSIQIMDTSGRLRGYLKANLRSVVRDKESLMPDFGPDRLTDQELHNLLTFLGTLRGTPPPARPADRSAADR